MVKHLFKCSLTFLNPGYTKTLKTAQRSTTASLIFLSLFIQLFYAEIWTYLKVGPDLFLPHHPIAIILRIPNVWRHIVTYTFEEASSNTPSIKSNFLSRKTRLQRRNLGKKLVHRLVRFSEASAKMHIRIWEVSVPPLHVALPDVNFGSVFVIPASYLGGCVSIIDPWQPLTEMLVDSQEDLPALISVCKYMSI